ncbi:DUF6207 family protein [Streptomyces sp. NPDC050523]|uniref:DUF6207 family protein n=1 Tax=Streptomyces sp. NPDC050523 TaxID=3365622 RepID=UPI0037B2AB45
MGRPRVQRRTVRRHPGRADRRLPPPPRWCPLIAAGDDQTAFAVQLLLAARCALAPAERTTALRTPTMHTD